jgi:preprotein translocase subunit SecG
MTIAYYSVLILHIVACLFLIGVVLLQQGKSQDLASAFGGGSGTQAAFGPRAGANVLTRATTILAAVFMVTSLALTVLRPASGVLDRIPDAPAATPSPAAAVPTTTAPAPAGSPVAQ